MLRTFNTSGLCCPSRHYMVDMTSRIELLKGYIDARKFFVLNRAKQYGKTTLLTLFAEAVKEEYAVFLLSFEGIGRRVFEDEDRFSRMFCGMLYDAIVYEEVCGISKEVQSLLYDVSQIGNGSPMDFRQLSNVISDICKNCEKPIVLLIDEVNLAGECPLFWEFMGLLRNMYLRRERRPALHSLALIGVFDQNGYTYSEQKNQMGGPWNIVEMFRIDMNFTVPEIAEMLSDYKADHKISMELDAIARRMHEFTNGYPYFVSQLCKIMDERLCSNDPNWTEQKMLAAVDILLREPTPLFSDTNQKLQEYPKLRTMLQAMLLQGISFPYNRYCLEDDIGSFLGFFREENEMVAVTNRIYETWMYHLFVTEDVLENRLYQEAFRFRKQFVKDDVLNMDLVLRRFGEVFQEVCANADLEFKERQGRRLFMLFLKPILSGRGNFFVDPATRDRDRTDIIVIFDGKKQVVTCKIWYGEEFNQREGEVLQEILAYSMQKKGYLLNFCVGKTRSERYRKVKIDDCTMVEVVV